MNDIKTETKKLLTVDKIGGDSRSFQLDTTATLTSVRAELSKASFMTQDDRFLFNGTPVEKSQEESITLSELLQPGKTTIYIGTAGPLPLPNGVERYNQLSGAEKKALFENVDIHRGLVPSNDGLTRSTRGDICAWSALPTATQPTVTSEKSSSYSFSEFSSNLTISGVRSGSVSLSTPFASGEAEYKHSKETSSDHTETTEYLVSRLWVRKIFLRVDREVLTPKAEFVKEVEKAVAYDEEPERSNYTDLLAVLDDWGYYAPMEFTLGGAIYAAETTKIKSFEESRKESDEFGASFQASFKGVGGGAAYKESHGKESSNKGSEKYKNTILRALGGSPVIEESDYLKWVESLDRAVNWVVIEHSKFYPSVALIKKADTITRVIKTLEKNAGEPGDHKFLNMPKYKMEIQAIFDRSIP